MDGSDRKYALMFEVVEFDAYFEVCLFSAGVTQATKAKGRSSERWTQDELRALYDGVEAYGINRWDDIKKDGGPHPSILQACCVA